MKFINFCEIRAFKLNDTRNQLTYKKGFKQLTFYDFKTYTFKRHWFISTSSTLLDLKNVNSSDIETKCLLRYNLPSNKLEY